MNKFWHFVIFLAEVAQLYKYQDQVLGTMNTFWQRYAALTSKNSNYLRFLFLFFSVSQISSVSLELSFKLFIMILFMSIFLTTKFQASAILNWKIKVLHYTKTYIFQDKYVTRWRIDCFVKLFVSFDSAVYRYSSEMKV